MGSGEDRWVSRQKNYTRVQWRQNSSAERGEDKNWWALCMHTMSVHAPCTHIWRTAKLSDKAHKHWLQLHLRATLFHNYTIEQRRVCLHWRLLVSKVIVLCMCNVTFFQKYSYSYQAGSPYMKVNIFSPPSIWYFYTIIIILGFVFWTSSIIDSFDITFRHVFPLNLHTF